MNRIVITARTHPDIDGVACALAYSELLQSRGANVVPIIDKVTDGEVLYVLSQIGLELARNYRISPNDNFILVDSSDLIGLPDFIDADRVVEIIDHRLHNQAANIFHNAKLQIEPVGAAATLIAERFSQSGTVPSSTSSTLLYAAIQSNTVQLNALVTTERDQNMAYYLENICHVPNSIVEGQFKARRAELFKDLHESLIREMKCFKNRKGNIMITQLEFPDAASYVNDQSSILWHEVNLLPTDTIVNIIDSGLGSSFLITRDEELRSCLETVLPLSFIETVAYSRKALLRKQIVAAVKGIQWR